MALNANALILPGRGTVFVGDPDETPPTVAQLATISPTSPPTGWDCLGHTSRDNTVAYSKDGGDATQRGSWWDDALVTTYDPVNWSLTVNSLQVDELSLGLAFGGGVLDDVAGTYIFGNVTAVDKAVLVLMVDGAKRLGIYHPNTSMTLGDAPEVSVDAFFEIQLLAQLLNSTATTGPYAGRRFGFISPALVAA